VDLRALDRQPMMPISALSLALPVLPATPQVGPTGSCMRWNPSGPVIRLAFIVDKPMHRTQ
jgi:hypothetical protein